MRDWTELVQWWPLDALDTALLLVGTLLLAQACNRAWERTARHEAGVLGSGQGHADPIGAREGGSRT